MPADERCGIIRSWIGSVACVKSRMSSAIYNGDNE